MKKFYFILLFLIFQPVLSGSVLAFIIMPEGPTIDREYTLVNTERVNRFEYDFTYQVTINNGYRAAQNVTGTVSSSSANTVIIDNHVSFNDLAIHESSESLDTFTLRQNRRHSFDPSALSWEVDFEPVYEPTGEIFGQVIDGTTGQAIASASISVDEQTTTTATNGDYTLQNVTVNDRVVVNVSAAGFADQSKIVQLLNQDSRANLFVKLLPIDLIQRFDPNVAQTLTVENSPARVELSASSLVQANGSTPNGLVNVNLTVIDPTIDIELMPGDMLTNVNGVLSPIESFGAITVTFTDGAGNDLNLAQDSTANIRIPLADKTGSPPTTIPLYFYDEINGLWIEEGTATLVTMDTGSYYEGTVTHFSTWNADRYYDRVLINGCIENSEGSPVIGARANSTGSNYSGSSSAPTDALGNFSIFVKRNASALIFGTQLGAKTNTIEVSTTASDQTLESCLLFSTANNTNISITLSWGENPADLNSRFEGSSGVYVNNNNLGRLNSWPYTRLDVDDSDGFGPEVMTISYFPNAGTYRYAVHNFSNTFNPGITDSPTRVELNVNGNTTLYIPPANEGSNRVWNVFEFNVSNDGSFVINPINTWTPQIIDDYWDCEGEICWDWGLEECNWDNDWVPEACQF